MKPHHILFAVLASIFWGLNFVAAKISLAEFPTLFMLTIRMVIVSAILLTIAKRPRYSWKALLKISLIMSVLNFSFGYGAIASGLNASVSAIIDQLRVPICVLLGALLLKERFRWKSGVGVAIAFSGTLFIIGSPESIGNPWGIGLAIIGATGWALYNLELKKLGKFDIFSLLGLLCLFGAVELAILSLLLESNHIEIIQQASLSAWLAIIYNAIFGTIIAQTLWCHLLHHYDVSEVTPFSLLVPFFGTFSAVVYLNEPLTWQIITGGLIIIAGVALVVIRRPKIAQVAAD